MNQVSHNEQKGLNRRRFVKITGISALGVPFLRCSHSESSGVSIAADPDDRTAGSQPSQWAVGELEKSLRARGIDVYRCDRMVQARNGDLCIVAGGSDASAARQLLNNSKTKIPSLPEALGIVPVKSENKQVLLVCGTDTRGLVYALLELADRVRYSIAPYEALSIQKPVIEQPANVIRSLSRLFVSDIEDKPWFNDREM